MTISYRLDPFDRRTLRQYAVVIFLPADLESIIMPIRERYDTDHNIISAHISLVFQFETSKSLNDLSSILLDISGDTHPLDIELKSIGDFYPNFPIIYWGVKPTPELSDLYGKLYKALEISSPHDKYLPHVTVAREISTHRVMLVKEKIVPYLPQERFRVEAIELVAPVADSSWVSVRTFPLSVI